MSIIVTFQNVDESSMPKYLRHYSLRNNYFKLITYVVMPVIAANKPDP